MRPIMIFLQTVKILKIYHKRKDGIVNSSSSFIEKKDLFFSKPLKKFKDEISEKIRVQRVANHSLTFGQWLFEFLFIKHSAIPNILSVIRMMIAIPLYINLQNGHNNTAFFIYTTALLTDFWDGHIARGFENITKLGKILDPTADKLITLAVLLGFKNDMPSFIFFGILAVAGILALLIFVLKPLAKRFDIQREISTHNLGKWKFAFECAGILLLFIARFMLQKEWIQFTAYFLLSCSIPLGVMSIIEYVFPGTFRWDTYKT